METAAYAYRQARIAGLSGSDMESFMLKQITNPDSDAAQWGKQRGDELIFVESPGKAIEQLMALRESDSAMGAVMKIMMPFIKTPANILRQGVRKSPAGIFSLGKSGLDIVRGKRKIDDKFIAHAAEQIIAWGVVGLIASLNDDDDELPLITGSSAAYGSAEYSWKANKIPPYSIRIGDAWYSYQRLEPFATGLAMIADGIESFRMAKNGADASKILRKTLNTAKQVVVEKSFLEGLGEINRIVQDPERSVAKAATGFIASWMPNAVRQTVNSILDDTVRDNRSRAKGEKFLRDQFYVITNGMGLTTALPKLDYFGREISKDAYTAATDGPYKILSRLFSLKKQNSSVTEDKFESLILRYNNKNPEASYYPAIPTNTFTVAGKKYYFEGEDYQEFARLSGQLAQKQINNAFKHSLLNAANPGEEDIKLIKKIFTRARKEVRAKMFKQKKYSK
jgi:hypothetical protein